MPHTARPAQHAFVPRNPDWEAAARGSFARQKVLALIGARLGALAPGHRALRLPSVEFKLNLLAPAVGDYLVAEGQVLKSGRNLVITRGEVYAIRGGKATHCATMQQTLMTMHGKEK